MKLFVVAAALIAVASAARLEHLERSYLPPDSFGANSNNFGVASNGVQNYHANGAFPSATSNQYLPPDQGSASSAGVPQFAGSLQGFGAQARFGGAQAPSSFDSNFQSQYQQQPGNQYQQQPGVNRQYLAPRPGAYQEPPQQAFDEQTGYHY